MSVIYPWILEVFDDYRGIVNIDKYDCFCKETVQVCLGIFKKTEMCAVYFRKLFIWK